MKTPLPFGTFRGRVIGAENLLYGPLFWINREPYILDKDLTIDDIYGRGTNIDELWFDEVHQQSLSAYTTINDSTGDPIFGSFPIDGVMTEGGDDINVDGEFEMKVEWKSDETQWVGNDSVECLRLGELITDYGTITITPRDEGGEK